MNRYYRAKPWGNDNKVRPNWLGIRPFWYAIVLSLLLWVGVYYAVALIASYL